MRVDRRVAGLLAIVTLASQCGCAGSMAQHGWLPYAQEAQREGYGGWIEVAARAQPDAPRLSGELLAVADDSVLVLTRTGVSGCALADVLHATVEDYDPRSGDVARMTLAGTLTSVSTGVGLILVAPLWIVAGSISSASLSHDGQVTMDASRPAATRGGGKAGRRSWKDLRLFARFPQGMPAGLDRSQLHLRTHVKRTERTKPMGPRDLVSR